MKVEIYEPDTDRVWRSIYAFSGNAFIEKDSSKNQIDVIGLVLRMIEPGQAYFIEKIRKEFVVSSESLCLIDIYVENQKVAIIARACTQSEVDKCKSQPSQRTEL
ncbi:hypothetical protein RF11_03362 [Thelohanellus kitauei]|uniref:Uncharacterized protein n=1 Tax=Thelohanellus kitauei TaxID=669202 RepID=A0A0C2MW69_THEKT|nr:hypothetical protein RF11_03362 [Thelohanellus kitauei]